MSRNYYSEINLHIVWHTKSSLPLLTPDIESFAHRFLRRRIIEMPGVFVHEIGGIETHVHIAITVPPTLLISEFIGKLKGGSAHDVNEAAGQRQKVLEWQAGYGVVSFGTRDLPWVIEYVANQREHHAGGTVHERLERIDQAEPVVVAQAVAAGRPVNGPDIRITLAGYPGMNAGANIAARRRVVNDPDSISIDTQARQTILSNQREHHARGTVHERLERMDQSEPGVVAQAVAAGRPVNGPGV